MIQKWRRYRNLTSSRRVLVIEAVFCLVAARLVIQLLPFTRIARHLGELRPPSTDRREVTHGKEVATEIAWALKCAARLLPFRLVCLPRALAGWQMLHRREMVGRLHFGAARNEAQRNLLTHAWLDACGVEVTGYPEAHGYVELGYYAQKQPTIDTSSAREMPARSTKR